jgi:anti-sigma regulatory factor (Ser/Thr protein kinase)
MEVGFTEWVQVTDTSSVGAVRRSALAVAERLGLDETRSGELALLATEASRNVLIHGGGGQVIVAGTREGSTSLARILAIDNGAGIPNIAKAMSDGFSTSGTMGGGLGAMKRIASTLDIFTGPQGTIVLIELGTGVARQKIQLAGLSIAYPGETVCGDGWSSHSSPERTLALLVDGLGHGWGAAEAAKEAVGTFHQRIHLPPTEILRYMHDALRKTRGAVAAIAEIRPQENLLIYTGVGNISAALYSADKSQSLVSHNGTLGASASKIQEFRLHWSSDSVLVMHSDGLHSKWDLFSYAGLISKHPAVIGGALLRDHRRQRDDASVVVVKAA